MINLPKPSRLTLRGSASEQNEYILTYLQQLVSYLEKVLGSLNKKAKEENSRAIVDMYYSGSALVVIRADGSEQAITFNS